jgi:hypothetical protein
MFPHHHFLIAPFRVVFILIAVFIFSSNALAIMRALSTEELTINSEVVIIGEVEEKVSFWSDDRKKIFTRVTVKIEEKIRGESLEERVEVEHEGGEIGGIGLRVSDVPSFSKGERVLLFLKGMAKKKLLLSAEKQAPQTDSKPETVKEIFSIFGLAQGKYTVHPSGIAEKGGFAILGESDAIDHIISLDILIEKIKSIR